MMTSVNSSIALVQRQYRDDGPQVMNREEYTRILDEFGDQFMSDSVLSMYIRFFVGSVRVYAAKNQLVLCAKCFRFITKPSSENYELYQHGTINFI